VDAVPSRLVTGIRVIRVSATHAPTKGSTHAVTRSTSSRRS